MTKTYDYYTVKYIHLPSGSIGAMGKRNQTLQDAKDQIEYLKTDKDKTHTKSRAYYIEHTTEVITIEKIEYDSVATK